MLAEQVLPARRSTSEAILGPGLQGRSARGPESGGREVRLPVSLDLEVRVEVALKDGDHLGVASKQAPEARRVLSES